MIGVVGAGWVAVWGGTCSGRRCAPGRETQMLYMGNGVGADAADEVVLPPAGHQLRAGAARWVTACRGAVFTFVPLRSTSTTACA